MNYEDLPEVHLSDENGRRACDPEHEGPTWSAVPEGKTVRLCEGCRTVILRGTPS